MTVESSSNKSGPFIASGETGVFPRSFLVFDPAHVRVVRTRDGVETDITTGISHSGMGSASGTVTLSQGIQSGDRITLLRKVPNVQRSDYSAQSSVPTDQVELDLDLLAMQMQDLAEQQGRALTLPVDTTVDGEEAMRAALAAPQYALEAKQAAESISTATLVRKDQRNEFSATQYIAWTNQTGTGPAGLDVRRVTSHSGGTAGFVRSALHSRSDVKSIIGNFENSMTAVLEDHIPQPSALNFCAFQGEARRKLAALGSGASIFGANILAKDETLQPSGLSGGAVIGLEVNVAARGIDDGNKRIILDLIPKCFAQAGSMEAYAAVRVKGTSSGGTTILKRGISIEPGGGQVNRGVHVEAVNEAYFATGTPSAVVDSLVGNAALIRLGSARSGAGDLIGTLAYAGGNSVGGRVSYGSITSGIVSPVAGAEVGSVAISVMIAGASVASLSINGSSPDNPVSLRLNGTLKAVTQGAPDSGGSGFRVLRVPN